MHRTTFTSETTAWLLMVERMPAEMLGASEAFVAAGMSTNVILLHIVTPTKQFNFIVTTFKKHKGADRTTQLQNRG
jgi:hypothetical protein